MATSKSTDYSPVQYEILQLREYLNAVVGTGLSQVKAKIISSIPLGTWDNGLGYASERQPKCINPTALERLRRVASKKGALGGEAPVSNGFGTAFNRLLDSVVVEISAIAQSQQRRLAGVCAFLAAVRLLVCKQSLVMGGD